MKKRFIRKNFIREKKVDCSNYREVDIIPRTAKAELAVKGKRGDKEKLSRLEQQNLNDKNARRYLVQLGNGNFSKEDIHVSATYSVKNYPASVEDAERIAINFLRRIAYRRMKLKLPALKYILVTEYAYSEEGETLIHIHHHIILNGGIGRDELETMWTKERINWKKYYSDKDYEKSIERIGYINADRIQPNENGIEALCKYVTKIKRNKKRWSSSRNLVLPNPRKLNDSKYTKKRVEQLAKDPNILNEFRKIYPKYDVISAIPIYYEDTGWHIYLKMWKKEKS